MNFQLKGNRNYCAIITKLPEPINLKNCDNIASVIIFGNHLIIPKSVKKGDIGIFFPIESKLSVEFLSYNNLYRDKDLNKDKELAGFFEESGRVRCVKMRGYKSEGFWIPINSLNFISENLDIKEGIEFDHIGDIKICEKYVIENKNKTNEFTKKDKLNNKITRFDKIRRDQFRFHIDTSHLGKNLHKFELDDIISITEKLHGTSCVISNVLCNRKLSLKDKIAKFLGVKVQETEYSNIYSSRKVIKNQYLYEKDPPNYYTEDIWKTVNNEIEVDKGIDKGISLYGEIVGFLKDGKYIQGSYDYGCKPKKHKFYIYRITYTSIDGIVYEFSYLQIKEYCKVKGLFCVPEHYYGSINDILKEFKIEIMNNWRDEFYKLLSKLYLEKDCYICNNKVPNEGIVIRREGLDIDSYKLKSFRFNERETKILDRGITNIEDN